MAKMTAPLLGFSASGKLADTLVYMTWKGLKTVRQYVIPANPNTEKQQTQRGFMTSANTAWHSVAWNAADLTAWNLRASLQAVVMSGFNVFVKLVLAALKVANTFGVLWKYIEGALTSTTAVLYVWDLVDNTTKCYYSTNKRTIEQNELAGTREEIGRWTFNLADLSPSTVYYVKFKNTAGVDVGETGIYTFETAAA